MEVTNSPSRKRDHDSFEELADLEEPCSVPTDFIERLEREQQEQNPEQVPEPSAKSIPTLPISMGNKRDPSPTHSTSGSLTDAGLNTSSCSGQSPMMSTGTPSQRTVLPSEPKSAFAALNSVPQPLPKKAKISFQEKEMRRLEKQFKDLEKATEKVRKEAEKQAHTEEKARKESEKEAERRKREAEKQAHTEEKARKDAEKEAERKRKEVEKEEKRAAQEAEKIAKEEKKRKKEEERRKKERSQPKLAAFFAVPKDRGRASSVGSKERSSMSPAPSTNTNAFASPGASTPSKQQITPYEKIFPAFFIQKGVTVAPITRFQQDVEATESIQDKIDSYIIGNRSPGRQRNFDAQSLFHLSPHHMVARGKRCMPVREIMEEMSGNVSKPIDLTTDSQNSQIKRTTDLLRKVPMKFLKFQEDVRPPYRGTYTSRPVHGMTKLARNPLRRDLPNTNYDYDSEAEWIEDEDGEDVKSDGDEDEDLEDDEDMDGFLDDENDDTAHSRKLVLQGDLEPVSTGLCWEDRRRRNTNVKMMPYRMEIILESKIPGQKFGPIDPFSTSYWDPVPTHTSMDPPRIPLNAMKPPNTNQIVNKSVKPYFTPVSALDPSQQQTSLFPGSPSPAGNGKPQKPKKLVPIDDMPAFKSAIEGSDLSKVGLIEVLKKKFPGRSAAAIKCTLEVIAKRVGAKEADKRWVLVEDS